MDAANHFPPGIVGEVARYIHRSAPYPNPDIALAGAFALMAGICGRAFNVSGAGLNLYVLVLAVTGSGKEANADAISRLMEAVGQTVPAARTFRGPGELASAPGLFKWLADNPATLYRPRPTEAPVAPPASPQQLQPSHADPFALAGIGRSATPEELRRFSQILRLPPDS